MNDNFMAVSRQSQRDDWGTPLELFDTVREAMDITVDAAATELNTLCDTWFGRGGVAPCGLSASWGDYVKPDKWVWCNPPCGRGITGKWAEKALYEWECNGVQSVLLIPARPSTMWWEPCFGATIVLFLRGRVRFVNPLTGKTGIAAPFDSALIINGYERNFDHLDLVGLGTAMERKYL